MKVIVPIFFHVPRCGGSYIYGSAVEYIKRGVLRDCPNIKCLEVWTKGEKRARPGINIIRYRIICTTDFDFEDNRVEILDLDFNTITPYFIEICPAGFSYYKEDILSKISQNIKHRQFMCLRDPYSHIRSMYDYLTSSASSHEATHLPPMLKSPTGKVYTFEELLTYTEAPQYRKYVWSNWLIKNIVDVYTERSDYRSVTYDDFQKAIQALEGIEIWNMEDIDKRLVELFGSCYDVDVSSIYINIFKNSSKRKTTLEFEDLSDALKSDFLEHTYWERKLYKILTDKQNNIKKF